MWIKDRNGNQVTLGYDAGHRITAYTDPRGKVSEFAYYSDGELHWEEDALGHRTTYSYSSAGATITDPLGRASSHAYGSGRLTNAVDAQGYGTPFTYDAANNKTRVKDQKNENWDYTYDARGNVLTATDPLGHTTTFTYNALDLPLTVTTHGGRTTTYTYDASGNRLTAKNPLHQTTTFTYDAHGQVLTVTDPLGHATTFAYDAHGNQTSVTDALGNAATFTYDALGRRLTESRGGLTTTTAYDGIGRVTGVTAPGGRVTSFGYDLAGNKTSQTNSLGQTDTFVYDDAGRLTSHKNALNHTVAFGYDAANNQTSFTDARGYTTTYGYNARDLRTSISYPDGTGEGFAYTPTGKLQSKTDGRGVVTTNAYDDADRLVGVSHSDGVTPAVSFAYDADGRKTGMTDGTGTTAYTWDNAGRLLSRAAPQGTVSYTWDAAGRKVTQTVGTSTTTYGYDNADRLTSVAAPTGTTAYTYDTLGRVLTVTNANGSAESRAYNATTGDLSQVWHKTPGGATLAKFNYAYDGLGRRTGELLADGSLRSWGYDAAGRLTSEGRTGALGYTLAYAYDAAGNRASRTRNSVAIETYAYDSANKLASVIGGAGGAADRYYTYDAAGNVTLVASSEGYFDEETWEWVPGDDPTSLAWDGAGRLKSITYPSAATNAFTYNGLGQRTGKADSTGTYAYTLADDSIDSAILSDGAATYQHGLGLLSEVRSGVARTYHLDSLGTGRVLSNSTGASAASLETDAFGGAIATTGTPGTPFGFGAVHGYQSDPDSGLMRLGHRYYDPGTGRFLSRDPIRDGYNWYAYCDGDPVNAVDPEGLQLQVAPPPGSLLGPYDPYDELIDRYGPLLPPGAGGGGGGGVYGPPAPKPPSSKPPVVVSPKPIKPGDPKMDVRLKIPEAGIEFRVDVPIREGDGGMPYPGSPKFGGGGLNMGDVRAGLLPPNKNKGQKGFQWFVDVKF